jgi:hypothetical protein
VVTVVNQRDFVSDSTTDEQLFTHQYIIMSMSWGRLLRYVIIGIIAVVAFQLALSIAAMALGITVATIGFALILGVTLATLAAIGVVSYGIFKLISLLRGEGADRANETGGGLFTDQSDSNPVSRIDELQQKYIEGELSEVEFERRLEVEFGSADVDSIDRELRRERE